MSVIQRGIFSGIRAGEKLFLSNYSVTKKGLESAPALFLEKISRFKAWQIYQQALENVPAYSQFLEHRKPSCIEEVPETDKENYVKKYSYESRCQKGEFPLIGDIEESSGSSGVPTNWIRSLSEENILFQVAKFEFYYAFSAHKKKYIVLSGWSSGPWATGLKFCEIIEHYTLVKNTTADIENILRTLKQLGPHHEYLIAGYPPFLKTLFDSDAVSWKKYNIDILTGGESNTLEWKDYIRKRLGRKESIIISSYGASDIDIGIGFETPLSEFIRGLANKNPQLNKELFGLSMNPILFQYNPTMHYIENTKKGDFTITLLDTNVASPKIKYNLHDRGGALSFQTVKNIVAKYEREKITRFLQRNKTLKLPFLFVAGRVDGTISIGGNNIYPQQIASALQSSSYASRINRFMLSSHIDEKQNVEFHIYVELKKGIHPDNRMKETLEKGILETLLQKNLEYKEYYHNHQSNQKCLQPRVIFSLFDTDTRFQTQDGKIKNQYISKD